jgi:hypothetical protein
VLALRRLDGSSTVKAFVKVKVGGITIKGCKVVEQPGQKAWLAMPSTKTAHGGQTVVEGDPALARSDHRRGPRSLAASRCADPPADSRHRDP